jgi:hypothetical protein
MMVLSIQIANANVSPTIHTYEERTSRVEPRRSMRKCGVPVLRNLTHVKTHSSEVRKSSRFFCLQAAALIWIYPCNKLQHKKMLEKISLGRLPSQEVLCSRQVA